VVLHFEMVLCMSHLWKIKIFPDTGHLRIGFKWCVCVCVVMMTVGLLVILLIWVHHWVVVVALYDLQVRQLQVVVSTEQPVS